MTRDYSATQVPGRRTCDASHMAHVASGASGLVIGPGDIVQPAAPQLQTCHWPPDRGRMSGGLAPIPSRDRANGSKLTRASPAFLLAADDWLAQRLAATRTMVLGHWAQQGC
jgi:hypothetical protein